MIETVTAQYEGTQIRLSAVPESLIDSIVETVVSTRQTISQITESVTNNHVFIAPTATLVESKQCKYTEKRAKIEKHCGQYVEAGMKVNLFAVSDSSDFEEKPPTDMLDDVREKPERVLNGHLAQ